MEKMTLKSEVDKDTFEKLIKLGCSNVIIHTPNGTFKQVEGLSMESQPAPQLANVWMSQFEEHIKGDSDFFARYVDDILVDVREEEIENRLMSINNLHANLEFTVEESNDITKAIPFLDVLITQKEDDTLECEWYVKPSSTGLMLNFNAEAPLQFKKNAVQGMIYRIYNASSTWPKFHTGIEKQVGYGEKMTIRKG